MIEISGDMVTTLISAVGNIVSQLWPVMAPIYGIIVAFFIARKIISFFPISK